MPRLEFWFDFASTYSYVAAMQIEDRCRDAGVTLAWRPFSLGPIFGLQGWNDSHYNLNERRGAYMWRDMERLAAKLAIPWRKPSAFPRNATVPLRTAAAFADEAWIGAFVRRTFVANFGEDRDIAERDVVAALLDDVGEPGAERIAQAEAPERRGALRANTERAVALGVCGAPNCIVDGELFWGEETLDDAIAWAHGRNRC